MNIRTYKFPQLTAVDIAFATIGADLVLLTEAKARGFYCKDTPYNELFSQMFFKGGKLNLKKDLPEDFRKAAVPYLKALAGSFTPSHEDKEAICALLLSELVDL